MLACRGNFVSEEGQCDSGICWQVIHVHDIQNGANDRFLENAGGDGMNGVPRVSPINAHPKGSVG